MPLTVLLCNDGSPLGHYFFEKMLKYVLVRHVLEGVACGAIGLVFNSALQLIRGSVTKPTDTVIFAVALGLCSCVSRKIVTDLTFAGVLFSFKHRLLGIFVMFCSGIAGYLLFRQT